jgi:membrane protease YdiL (CAAX protease family)
MPRVNGWRADLVAIIVLLVALNLATGFVLDGWVSGVVQIGTAVAAVAVALRRGYTPAQLGLDRRDLGSGLRLGGIVSAVIAAVVALAALVPFSRGFFDDERFVDLPAIDAVVEVALRIPIVTALSEELLFRSVLLAVLLVATSTGRAVAVSSLLFGLWHVLTTIGDLDGNAATDELSTWEAGLGVVGVVVATGLAGAGFCWLRLRSGSIAAPWLVHTVLNASTYLAGFILVGGGHIS